MTGVPAPTTQIALLRGINLGRSRRIAMADLRDALGHTELAKVRTHLQSGNVVFASDSTPEQARKVIEEAIGQHLGMDVRVVTRTRDELADAIERDPCADLATDPKRHQVTFLSAPLPPEVQRQLLATDVAPEQIAVSGREIYTLHPDGIAPSALTPWLTERRLQVNPTTRNWNTVTKLLELADA